MHIPCPLIPNLYSHDFEKWPLEVWKLLFRLLYTVCGIFSRPEKKWYMSVKCFQQHKFDIIVSPYSGSGPGPRWGLLSHKSPRFYPNLFTLATSIDSSTSSSSRLCIRELLFGWPGGVVVRASDLWSRGRKFDSILLPGSLSSIPPG